VTQRTGTTEIPFQCVGQKGYYSDRETGSYSVRQRPLGSSNGRWLAPEQLEFDGEANRYSYALNGPLSFVDPSGLSLTPWRPGSPLPVLPPCVTTTTVDYQAICTFRKRNGSIVSDIVGCVPGRAKLCCDIFAKRLWPWWFGWVLISAQGLKKTTTYETCWHWTVAGTGRVVAPPVVAPAPVRTPICPGPGLGPLPFVIDLVIFLLPVPITTTEVDVTLEPAINPQPGERPVGPGTKPDIEPPELSRKWTCTCKCNVHMNANAPPGTRCPNTVHATASGSDENSACSSACANARSLAPRGCQTKHCGCKNRCAKA
jgi:RHS repeat-associated protein